MLESALMLLKKINSLGYEAYIVGGFPRNKYLNINSDDIDICTNAKSNFFIDNFNVIKDNSRFGSVTIEYNNYNYEITTYRKDIYKGDRFPDIIFVDTLLEDLLRRDFTINTLCIDLNNNYVDLINARKDIDLKIIKTINDADISLKEDPLRIVRAIRFSINLDFKIDEDLKKSIVNNKNLINDISNNRLEIELNKINKNDKYYKLIEELDLTKYLK